MDLFLLKISLCISTEDVLWEAPNSRWNGATGWLKAEPHTGCPKPQKQRPYHKSTEVWFGLTKEKQPTFNKLYNLSARSIFFFPNKELQECSRDMLYLTQITKHLFQAISCNFTGPLKFNFFTLTKYGFLWKKIKTRRKKSTSNMP